ncbi:hypothetical protein FOL01_0423 [Weissella jogaejeotgali]|uniref:Transcriptional regulator n=1 Tax=Weissella jogaejeotgali TaxID=1631871 RepID=A0A1L6R9U8_9LACO|nr:hypothetical protein [Weissella jogaejeotgali]APS41282.1 hypothetical protein FOL01_0423 [Weissella jogaejeotgali]
MADKRDWREKLIKADLTQEKVGEFIGLDKGRMSALVKKMIIGEGKTASELDRKRWQRALDFINLKQREFSEGK